MQDYDVIVIGSGIGGLTAAALLAKAGNKVLVLEAHDRPGGYAHSFKRKRYHFDAGVHLISGCGPQGYQGGQMIYRTLKAIGVLADVEFITINPFSHARYPDLAIALPQSLDAFSDALSQYFPAQRTGLQQLLALCLQMAEEIAKAYEIMANKKDAQRAMPALYKYRKTTLSEVAGHYVDDAKLMSIFATNWPFLGLPPSKVSFMYWSAMMMGYMADGAYYCQGGFQSLADALVSGLTKHGGAIEFKSHVDKILIENNRVHGVLCNGNLIAAPTVVANADMQQTIYQLVGKEYFPKRFLQRIENLSLSLSIFTVYIATDLIIPSYLAHETFCYQDYDHELNFQRTLRGDISWLSITVPTLVDPSLAPPGRHIIMLTTLLPYQVAASWKSEKPKYLDVMLKLADRFLPGLQDHLLYVESGSPATMHRYTQNHLGAAYGWNVSPCQVGPLRVTHQAPVTGLFFAGHWTAPGGGIYGVSVSGVQAAQKVLGINNSSEFWRHVE